MNYLPFHELLIFQKNGNLCDSNGIKERIAKEIEHLKTQLLKNQTQAESKVSAFVIMTF